MNRKTILVAVIILVFSLNFFGSTPGRLRGFVKDKMGNPIEGVTITLSSTRYSAVKYTLKTNDKGEFFQIGLQPEYYQIKAEKDGYLPVIIEKRVRMEILTKVSLEMEEGNYHIGKSPGEDDFEEGLRLFEEGKYEEAIQSFQRASEKEPFEPSYVYNLGVTYYKMEKHDEAIVAYMKMLEIQPDSYSAYKKLGEIYGLKKEFKEAIPYYIKAAELSPEDPDALYDLGACLINTKNYPHALETLSKTVELKPDYALAYYQLGMIHVNQNHKDEAIKNLEKYLELAPEDSNVEVAKQLVKYLKTR